jgi:hypothetical protein
MEVSAEEMETWWQFMKNESDLARKKCLNGEETLK